MRRSDAVASQLKPRPQDAVPPHDGAGDEHDRGRQSEYCPNRFRHLIAESRTVTRDADAVHSSAGWSGKKVVVQVEQFGDEPDAGRDRCAQIAAGSRIEQALLQFVTASQPDIYGLIAVS